MATQQTHPTRSGLLPESRHLILPKGIAASGWPRIRETCKSIGITFDPWQVDLNRCLEAKTADGLFAADTAGLSIARQVGKTFDVGAVMFARCIADAGTTVVWTAHRFKVARETFNELRALAKSPKLVPHIDYDAITTAAGNEMIPFRNGSRIVFAARERGAIRGFTKVRYLVLDEAQILTAAALADLAPTMNQAVNPQIILMGTPPKPSDPSEVWTNLRTDALAGDSEGVLYVELSADPKSDPNDRDAWSTANPSYPQRTSSRAILRLKRLLTPDDFAREALGIWDGDLSNRIPADKWAEGADIASAIVGSPALAVSMTPDLSTVSLVAMGRRRDGQWHVEVVEHAAAGDWFIPRVADVARRHNASVWLHPGHPAGTLLADLLAADVDVRTLNGTEYAQACGSLYRAVLDGTLHYRPPQPSLDAAVTRARQRKSGETWKWDGEQISPLIAATQALHGAQNISQGGWAISL